MPKPHARSRERQHRRGSVGLVGRALAQQHRGGSREDEADAAHDGPRDGLASMRLLFDRIEILDIGMGLDERGMAHARGNQKRQADENGGQHRHEKGRVARTGQKIGHREQHARGDAQDDDGHTRRHREGPAAHMLIIAAHVDGRARRRHRNRLARTVRQIAAHQIVERAIKDAAHIDELVHLGIALLRLPLGDGLPADAEQHRKLLLGHVARRAQMLEVVAKAHGAVPFVERALAHRRRKRSAEAAPARDGEANAARLWSHRLPALPS